MERARDILRSSRADLLVSKQRLRQSESIHLVRTKRKSGDQELGYSSRPFVLCGLPVKRPAKGVLLHERRNGRFFLQVTGHPRYGLPWGQDRLVPIFLATLATRQKSPRVTFPSAADMLETFGLQQGGSQYRRLIAAFERIFGATIFFGTDTQLDRAVVVHQARFHFMREATIWCSRDSRQGLLPCVGENVVILTDEFFREVLAHPIPIDLESARALSCSPAVLDLFTWLSYRCFISKREERVPLFGEFGLSNQLGCGQYNRTRRFRERMEQWLVLVRAMWPECPARISRDGQSLLVNQANAMPLGGDANVCA
jgi:hypothetical protein